MHCLNCIRCMQNSTFETGLKDKNDDKLKSMHAYSFTYRANFHNSKIEIMTVKKYTSDTKSCLSTQSTLYFVAFVLRCLIFVILSYSYTS